MEIEKVPEKRRALDDEGPTKKGKLEKRPTLSFLDEEEDLVIPAKKPVNDTQISNQSGPLDVELLLKRRQEEENEKSRPIFKPKQERLQKLVEEKAKEVETRVSEVEKSIKARERFLRKARHSTREQKSEERREERPRESSKREEKNNQSSNKSKPKEVDLVDPSAIPDEKLMEKLIQKHFFQKRESKRLTKAKDKYKFHFEWDDNDDTSDTLDPMYASKHKIQPMFGRGLIAGIDERSQLTDYRSFLGKEEQLVDEKRRGSVMAEQSYTDIMLKSLNKTERPAQHWREKRLETMSERDWRIFREDYEITTKGGGVPHPIRHWEEYPNIRSEIKMAIEKVGYKEPTPIQRQAIPVALSGRDLIGIAETGSGKTAAFVIPMLEYILDLPRMTPDIAQDGPYAVIMAPARELAIQIEQEVKKFARFVEVRVVLLVGGVSIEEQAAELRHGCEVVVATPGRLVDCLKTKYIVLNQCTYVVLDEADKMIDMGFEEQVSFVLQSMPSSHMKSEIESEAEMQEQAHRGRYRTTILYSATFAPAIQRIATKYLRRAVTVLIGEAGRATDRIEQRIEWLKDPSSKLRTLRDILLDDTRNKPPIIIFANMKSTCEMIAREVEKLGFTTTTLHSGRGQYHREQAIEGFKTGKFDIMIATDLAARGLDVKGVTHVINFDMPATIEAYTHRIGRTGRAGLSGLATSFLTNDNTDIMWDLKQNLISTNNLVIPELANHPSALVKPGTIQDKPKKKNEVLYARYK